MAPMSVILASASPIRSKLLLDAGVLHDVVPAHIDEGAVKTELIADGASPGTIAERLGELKAVEISASWPGHLIIGADQVLACDGVIYDKPKDKSIAKAHLLELRGKSHKLWTSVIAVHAEKSLWHHTEVAVLTMRNFSVGFLDSYLAVVTDETLACAGSYQLEGMGVQLFSEISADYFTTLGLPLLPLLRFLRANDIIRK